MIHGESLLPLPLDDDFIDRIVDGVLTSGELRGAIERLDREPDGWRRCGLAFLEAQCWGEAMRALDPPVRSHPQDTARRLPQSSGQGRRPARSWRSGTIGAGIAAASFALGWLIHTPHPASTAGVAAAPPPIVPSIAVVRDDPKSPLGTPGIVAPSRPADALATLLRDDGSPPNPSGAVVTVARLRVGSEGDSADVPILAGPGIDADWLRQQPPPLTEHGEVLWQRRGYQVDQRRRIVTATLADGRLVTLPVDQVELRYTGNDPL